MIPSSPFLLSMLLLVPTWTVQAFVPPTTSFVHTCHEQQQQQQRHSSLQALEDLTSKLIMDGSSSGVAGSVLSLPSLDAVNGIDPMVLGGGAVAVLVLATAVAATTSSSNNSNEGTTTGKSSNKSNTQKQQGKVEPQEPIDVSIPYNAAALLAYQQVFVNGQETDAEFATFQQMYKDLAVAQVTLKRKQQQVEALEQAFAEKYPTTTTTPTPTTTTTVVNGDVVKELQTV